MSDNKCSKMKPSLISRLNVMWPARMFRCLIVLAATTLMATSSYGDQPPAQAKQFQRSLTREAHAFWGLNAPIALFAGQIHQESLWRPGVSSRFASGLTQFTDNTAEWIAEVYPNTLGGPDVFNPEWSIRAMVLYDRWLYDRVPEASSEHDKWAFTLASYNGGLGWVKRDVKICAATPGCDPQQWFGHVELYSDRADWAIKENRGYIKILTHRQYIYNTWGLTIDVGLEIPRVQCRIRLFN